MFYAVIMVVSPDLSRPVAPEDHAMKRKKPRPPIGPVDPPHDHVWFVYSTALLDVCLLVRCLGCGATGYVADPTTDEWSRAFNAPTDPYRWDDESRVTVDP
jgi:hypothetical protein